MVVQVFYSQFKHNAETQTILSQQIALTSVASLKELLMKLNAKIKQEAPG